MTTRTFAITLLSLFLALGLPACGGSKKNPFGSKKSTERTDSREVGSVEGPVIERNFPTPTAEETLYLLYLRDAQNRPVKGVMTMVLVQQPEGLDIRQPRIKTIVARFPSGSDGIAPIMSKADGLPKFAWVGGRGVWPPKVYPLDPAVGGTTVKKTLSVPLVPVAKLVFTGPDGLRVPDGIITFKENSGSDSGEQIGDRPSQSDNYGNTKRTNSLGEVEYSRAPGTYRLIATDEQGRNRLYALVQWSGDESKPLEFTLPATSMTEQDRPW